MTFNSELLKTNCQFGGQFVNICNKRNKNSKVFQNFADIQIVSESEVKRKIRKGFRNHMRIENEMLSRFNTLEKEETSFVDGALSKELDFFFDNVMDSVVTFFQEEVTV